MLISIYVFKFLVIQFMKLVTLVYTPGYWPLPHPIPQLTIPTWVHLPSFNIKGPPLSPCFNKKTKITYIFASKNNPPTLTEYGIGIHNIVYVIGFYTYTARVSCCFARAQEVVYNPARSCSSILELAFLICPHRHIDFLQNRRLWTT